MDPALEVLLKWSLLAYVLKEIEEDITRHDSLGTFWPSGKFPPN